MSTITFLAAAATASGSPAQIWQHIVGDFASITEPAAFAALGSVLIIDLVLAADNAVVVGALAAGLPPTDRRKVIAVGIGAALILRIIFALIVTSLMRVVGLIFAGGLLLLWVSWKFWYEIRSGSPSSDGDGDSVALEAPLRSTRSLASAVWTVAVADVSMSLDNVLAVAGAAREHPGILIVGLMLSVALMGIAANFIARIIYRHRWVAYIGLAVILLVAIKMMYEGWIGTGSTVGIASWFY